MGQLGRPRLRDYWAILRHSSQPALSSGSFRGFPLRLSRGPNLSLGVYFSVVNFFIERHPRHL